MDGLYSITEGGQLKWTVDINGENGMRTTPGNEDQVIERGRMVLEQGSFQNSDKRGLALTGPCIQNLHEMLFGKTLEMS